ncbi:MAG TPA: GntR family transcriptional regulator [Steroidobacteraceae bacterium]|nr:GntR family transcriptional regulator [Steroidobacteraceae bacterium]
MKSPREAKSPPHATGDVTGRTRSSRPAKRARGTSASKAGRPRSPSLAQQAYDELKLRIISLQYRPGAALAEAGIAQDLGIGRMPVREAIARLALEDMLEVLPRKGVLVRPVSLDEARANIEARLVNEPAITRLAVERASEQDIAGIAAALREVPDLIRRRDIRQLMLVDWRFHGLIARAARNPFLESILGRLHERSLRFWFISLSHPRHLAQVHEEHLAIVAAFQRRDAAGAEAAVAAHIRSFRDTISQTL